MKIIYLMPDFLGHPLYYARGKTYRIKTGWAFGRPNFRTYGCATDNPYKATKSTFDTLKLLLPHYPMARIVDGANIIKGGEECN